jgi:alpha-galactosidase
MCNLRSLNRNQHKDPDDFRSLFTKASNSRMMAKQIISALLLFSFVACFASCAVKPSEPKGRWYKGNTHTHAKLSDKHDNDDVPKIAGWYRKAGYDFLLLSEHNGRLEKKKIICHDELTDPGQFLMFCGLELSKGRHMTAFGIDKYIGDDESLEDGVNKTLKASGIPILNHPHNPFVTAKDFIAVKGLNHLEVFNANRPQQTSAVEMLWDSVLSSSEGRPVYGVASDDNHYNKSKVGRGWIMVDSPALTKKDIMENIRNGNFYASTGVYLTDYVVTDKSISIVTRNGDLISFIGKNGKELGSVKGPKATYIYKGDELYIRAKIKNKEGSAAWTQPVFLNRKKSFNDWAVTPPMGWNSWDCYGPTVTEAEVKANADYMSAHLKDYGWEYIVVDIRWYVANDKALGYNQTNPQYSIDKYGRFIPAVNRFPSSANGEGFKTLADYIHSKGLKFGIHVMRGVPVIAVKNKLPVLGTKVTAADIYSPEDQCQWLKDMYTVVEGRYGSQEYYNSIISLYASWGVDFLKIDDLSSPYHAPEIEMIRKAIDLTGRRIVLSTSPGPTPVEKVSHIKQNANMWRTVGDFWDNWPQLKEQFNVFEKWSPFRSEGSWPDGDMLPLGHIGIRAERGKDRSSLFTKDEQYTLMTLFSIFRSPLMFGGNLPDNDPFTLSLLTNREALLVHGKSTGNKQIFNKNDRGAWLAGNPETGDKYLALFYTADRKMVDRKTFDQASPAPPDSVKITVDLKDLGFDSNAKIYDIWKGQPIGAFSGEFSPWIKRHGCGFYRISK